MAEAIRRIIHLDMDAFYASVEQRDDPGLRGRPVAVGGSPQSRGVVAAASYEARAFGVRSAMPMARAVRRCPELLVVRPDFARYREASRRLMEILRSVTPLVEPLSLDEAYLDVTVNWWREPLAAQVARELKRRIRDELSLTASAGVAPNKFLAKIASGWRKPNGLTIVAPARVEAFLRQLPIEALWGVGPVTAARLKSLGIQRVVDIRTADPAVLRVAVGNQTQRLIDLAYGRDPRPVTPDRPWKSISAETTYAEDLRSLPEVRAGIAGLARRVATSLERRNLRARTVTIKVRYEDFSTITRSHSTQRPTRDVQAISQRALGLLARTEVPMRPVRLLGVGVHGLSKNGSESADKPGSVEDNHSSGTAVTSSL